MGDELRCNKNATSNVHIYRRTMVYARLAEAMNASGYPRFAFAILSSGLNNTVLENEVIPYYRADSTFLREFNFPVKDYVLATKFNNRPAEDSTAETSEKTEKKKKGFREKVKEMFEE